VPPPRRQADRSDQTRRALVDAARPLFAERGYAGVGTEEVVRRAGVTRGALYHHFTDKRDLFRGVFEDLEAGLVAHIGERVAGIEDPLALLAEGIRVFLDLSAQPELARISLVDAPAVLGWEEWREIDARYGMGLLRGALQAAADAGALRPAPVDALAHVLLGALGEAGMLVAHAEDKAAARAQVEPALLAVLDGLRAP
jgi:AcrR family transcriptional regulator